MMTLDEYQRICRTTAIYTTQVVYPALGLAGEAGEVCEKVKKWLRDEGGVTPMPEDRLRALEKELGDVLWYVSNIASDLGLSLGQVAQANVDKLASRKNRGVLGGSGDSR